MGPPPHASPPTRSRNPPDLHGPSQRSRKENPGARGTPGHPARQPGRCHTPALKPGPRTRAASRSAPAINPDERSGPDPRPKLRAAGRSDDEISKIRQALDSLNYGNPKGLILITAWNEAWNERAAGTPATSLPAAKARQIPWCLPDGVEKLPLIDPDLAAPDVQELWRQAKDLFLYHAPASDYRVLAAWPDVLRIAVEDILTPVALTAEYEETARRIRAIARKHVAGFSDVGGVSRRQMSNSLSGPEIAGLTGLLFMYNRFIADITIAMIRVKQALDGASSATENKFPVT